MRKPTLLLLPLLLMLPAAASAEERVQATTKEAEMMVHKAAAYIQKEGKEKAIAAFNDPKGPFSFGDLYVVAVDLDGKVLAHPHAKQVVGNNLANTKDASGKPHFSHQYLDIGKGPGKGWMEYAFENPVSHKTENKVAYVERAGDVIVVCGIFKPAAK
jgi:cytochrome c